MATFDSTKVALSDLLHEILEGKVQLPDFQRGWVWDDDHIRSLLASVGRSFPIGTVMLLEAGGGVRFECRPVEGLEKRVPRGRMPEKLILDGQQRLTTLTQVLALEGPVRTRTAKGKRIERHYYFDIRKALALPQALEDAIVAVDVERTLRSRFGRRVELDLSSTELECRELHFPCRRVFDSDEWEEVLHEVAPEHFRTYMTFRKQVLDSFRRYQVPVILLKKETSKEAICLVFEKVNTGGVPLSVFELVTASYAAEGYSLRDDWFGSKARRVTSRKARLEEDPLLVGIEPTEFLQALCLLHTHDRREADRAAGRSGKEVRPLSAKRSDVLQVPLSSWRKWADPLEEGFRNATRFLRRECLYSRRDLPYRTQLVPLAAVMVRLGDRWLEPRHYDGLARWYWCGVLGELYGGAVETRIASDYEGLLRWFEDDEAVPRTVRDASFQRERLDTLRSRLSAAYKGIHVLLLREGACDWFWKSTVRDLDIDEVRLDIHHVFPRKWCEARGIPREIYDSILNKTVLSFRANRKMGGDAPSRYLARLQRGTGLTEAQMDDLVATHALDPSLLRADDFDGFLRDRRERLVRLVARAIGKAVSYEM